MQRQGKKLKQVARLQALGLLKDPNQDADESDGCVVDAAAAFGLQLVEGDEDGDADPEPVEIFYLWPCNVPTFAIWQQIQTQWVIGPMGDLEGLNYAGVISYMREVAGIKRKDFAEMFSGLQVMEEAVRKVQAEKRPR